MLIWISAALAGLFAALLMGRALLPLARGVAGPHADLPGAWRVGWPWVMAFLPLSNKAISWRTRRNVDALLAQAALESHLTAAHITAAQWLAAIVGLGAAVCFAWLLSSSATGNTMLSCVGSGAVAALWPRRWLGQRAGRRRHRIDRELPFMLDMTMLCVEAGLNLQGALQQAAIYGPPGPLRHELQTVLSEMRTGMPRIQALKALAGRTNVAALRTLVSSLVQADLLGMNLGPILRAQAAQCRVERFQRAETLAMQAPVKMLFPLIACIFPCTFIVIGFPIAVSVMELHL
jgi:tight adherence protein C